MTARSWSKTPLNRRDRRIVELWQSGQSGGTIAAMTGDDPYNVWARVRCLQKRGLIDKRQEGDAPRQRVTADARPTRRCLTCGDAFPSLHIGNRICPSCLGRETFSSGFLD